MRMHMRVVSVYREHNKRLEVRGTMQANWNTDEVFLVLVGLQIGRRSRRRECSVEVCNTNQVSQRDNEVILKLNAQQLMQVAEP